MELKKNLDRFLSKREVATITGRSATSVWRDCNAGTFPAPRQIGPGRVAWLESEVMAWMESRPLVVTRKRDAAA